MLTSPPAGTPPSRIPCRPTAPPSCLRPRQRWNPCPERLRPCPAWSRSGRRWRRPGNAPRHRQRRCRAGSFYRGRKRVRTNNGAKSVSGNTGITDQSGKEAKRTLTGFAAGLPRAASRGEAYTVGFPFLSSRPPVSCRCRAATIGRFSAFALRMQMCNDRGQAPFARAQFAFSRAQAGPSRPQRASSRRQNAPARRPFARVRLER